MHSVNEKVIHIFDCDGVLLNSNLLKIDALASALQKVAAPDDFVAWALEEFRTNFGRTRRNHFSIFQSHRLENGYMLSKSTSKLALIEYKRAVVKLYKDCKAIPETKSYIDGLECSSNFYVVSASDQTELREILPTIFNVPRDYIFGGPSNKVENIKKVIAKNHRFIKFILYGDSVADAQAALKVNIDFIGLTEFSADPEGLVDFCRKNHLSHYANCSEIPM